MLSSGSGCAEVYDPLTWPGMDQYNIGEDACGKGARIEPDRPALIYLAPVHPVRARRPGLPA